MGSFVNDHTPQSGTPTTSAYPEPFQYASAPPPPPPPSAYPVPTPPLQSPPAPPMHSQPHNSNPAITTLPIHQLQENPQASAVSKSNTPQDNIVPILVSIITTGIYYGILTGSTGLVANSTILIVVGVGFLLVTLTNVIILCIFRLRPLAKLIPFLFSTITSLTLIIFFVAVHIAKTDARLLFDNKDLSALIGSIGLFAGLTLGSAIMYSIQGV